MIIYYDSIEVQKLRQLINNKKQYLKKLTGKAYQYLQAEIMYLENQVLPILLQSTNIAHHEFANYAVKTFDTALQYKCNGLLFYQSLNENYTEQPIIGIVNDKYFQPYGKTGSINITIDNMDGNQAPVKPFILAINGLL